MTPLSICITLYVLGWFTTSWLWLRYMTSWVLREEPSEICWNLFVDLLVWWLRLPVVLFSITLRDRRD